MSDSASVSELIAPELKSVVWLPDGPLLIVNISVVKAGFDQNLAELDPDVELITLDLSAHRDMDGAGLQMLLVLQDELTRRGIVLHLQGVSGKLLERFASLQLTRAFHLTNNLAWDAAIFACDVSESLTQSEQVLRSPTFVAALGATHPAVPIARSGLVLGEMAVQGSVLARWT